MFDLTLLSTQEPLVVGGGFGLVGLSGLLGGIGGGNVMLRSLIWVSERVLIESFWLLWDIASKCTNQKVVKEISRWWACAKYKQTLKQNWNGAEETKKKTGKLGLLLNPLDCLYIYYAIKRFDHYRLMLLWLIAQLWTIISVFCWYRISVSLCQGSKDCD